MEYVPGKKRNFQKKKDERKTGRRLTITPPSEKVQDHECALSLEKGLHPGKTTLPGSVESTDKHPAHRSPT